jgi:hypothetical protein
VKRKTNFKNKGEKKKRITPNETMGGVEGGKRSDKLQKKKKFIVSN